MNTPDKHVLVLNKAQLIVLLMCAYDSMANMDGADPVVSMIYNLARNNLANKLLNMGYSEGTVAITDTMKIVRASTIELLSGSHTA